ncbi:FRG domain-containing protein [Bartonella sp. HY329]|uniref:FRG domain-containing protein n=1 Tax=unclassified Bartonella TaxID=2645622 RepID=UPI0021C6BA2D|nr:MULTISPECIES: FRG domain-containing protein [unclassified Bartonella]UXM95382.1 FRG domain-containing protein [Bartonella sp. HY329]UXN09707.1 FRG domain-containing protein [Bartonella sp. HY328]
MINKIQDEDHGTIINCPKLFLEIMRKSNDLWHNSKNPHWVFRGQSNANWSLIPSVWRNSDDQPYFKTLLKQIEYLKKQYEKFQSLKGRKKLSEAQLLSLNQMEACAWVHMEFALLNEFKRRAWLNAYPVHPNFEDVTFFSRYHEYHHPFNIFSREISDGGMQKYVLAKVDPSSDKDIALAQHYNIPTRMLDWTENPLIASYFASYNDTSCQNDIVIFALDLMSLSHLFKDNWDLRPKKTMIPLLIYATFANRRENIYIRAQEGLLTSINWHFAQNYYASEGRWPSYEDAIIAGLNVFPLPCNYEIKKFNQKHGILRKFILPQEHVTEFKRLLKREDITKEKIFPSLDNIAEAAKASFSPEKIDHCFIHETIK